MTAINEKLVHVLKELERNSDVFGSAIVTKNGQMMASALHNDIPEKSVAAMSAALTSVASRVADTLTAGDTKSIVINGSEKIIIAHQLEKAVMVCLAPSDAKIGLVEYEVENSLDKLKTVLG